MLMNTLATMMDVCISFMCSISANLYKLAVVNRYNRGLGTLNYFSITVADMKLRQQLLFVLKSVAFLTIPLVDYAMLVQADELTPTSQRAVITSREQTLIATFITTVLFDATFLLLYARNQR